MKITKLTVKIFLIISLFASVALADGQIGGGGFADDGQIGGGGKVADDGSMGSGGLTDSVMIFVEEYLAALLG